MASPASVLGRATPWAQRTRTCPPSSRFPIRAGFRRRASITGGPASCQPSSRAPPSARSDPVRNLGRPKAISPEGDLAARSLLQKINEEHLAEHPGDSALAARIASYELAARMQLSVPEISDLSTEPAHILKMYGADDSNNAHKAAFARNCILARRLIESGVRFVQLFNGAYASAGKLNWDGHNELKRAVRHPRRDPRPAGRRAGARPEAARAARGHAGRLVHRVRPHADVPEGGAGPRPQPGRLHRLARRRRGEARGQPRRDR